MRSDAKIHSESEKNVGIVKKRGRPRLSQEVLMERKILGNDKSVGQYVKCIRVKEELFLILNDIKSNNDDIKTINDVIMDLLLVAVVKNPTRYK